MSDDPDRVGLATVQATARDAVSELLAHEFDGFVAVEPTEDGWRALVEVVERHAVPDTQDVLGRYELTLAADGSLTGYELRERYRRGETREEM